MVLLRVLRRSLFSGVRCGQSAEKTILEMLKPKFVPLGHKFIAEETASLEPLTDAPTWVSTRLQVVDVL